MNGLGRRGFTLGTTAALSMGALKSGHSSSISAAAVEVTKGCQSPRAKAVALFEFVRDEIRFGFTSRFDSATPRQTLRAGRGHCNPQAALLVALMREVGLEARHHIVHISNAVLHGLFPSGLPSTLDHTYVEVRLDGDWIPIDGYIVDRPLLRGALPALKRDGRELGYGVHTKASIDWDGETSCMAQLVDQSMVLRDFGTFEDQKVHFDSSNYSQRLGALGSAAMAFMAPGVNRRLDELR